MTTPNNSHDHHAAEHAHAAPGLGAEPSSSSAAGGEASPVDAMLDRLRGRWVPMVLLGLVLGLVCAYLGYRFAPMRYASVGRVHVSPAGAPILRPTSETEPVYRYDGVVLTQAALIATPRIVDLALESPEMASLPLAVRPDARELILANLEATVEKGSEIINVRYEAGDPDVAQTVVNAVLDAYEAVYGSRDRIRREARVEHLRTTRDDLRRQRTLKRAALDDLIADSAYGGRNIDLVLDAKVMQLEQLKQDLRRINLILEQMADEGEDATVPWSMLAASETDQTRGPAPGASDPDGGEAAPGAVPGSSSLLPAEPTQADLDAIDPELPAIRRTVTELQAELDQAASRFYPTHRAYMRLEEELEVWRSLLEERQAAARQAWATSGGLAGEEGALSVAQLGERRNIVASAVSQVQGELQALNDYQSQLDQARTELDEIEQALAEVDSTINTLQIESNAQFAGNISIAEYGARSLVPVKDRRGQLAAIGFGGGFGLSVAAFLLLGTLRPRAWSYSQFARPTAAYPCLGTLPELGRRRPDPETSDLTAECVHQIRNRIEALRQPSESFLLAVTSPFQGDGKTSLAMALGWSYAVGGYRTLLVDCDFLGRDLTQQIGMHGREGLREALRNRHLNGQIAPMPLHNLSVLGIGRDRRVGPEAVRRDELMGLCEQLRRDFDIVIIDAGPVGSLEVTPLAVAADATILTIRRGRPRTGLDRAVDELHHVGARPIGVVLNGASRADCVAFAPRTSQHTPIDERSLPDTGVAHEPPGLRQGTKGKPLAQVMERAASRTLESDSR